MSSSGRRPRQALRSAGTVLVCFALSSPATLNAEEDEARPPSWHLFFGGEATSRSLSSHQGLVWAPLGHLHEPGVRLRAMSTAGAYRYDATSYAIPEHPLEYEVIGQSMSVEILAGFEWMRPRHGISAYVGGTVEDHRIQPPDPSRRGLGTHGGVKGFVEGWLRISDALLLDGSAAYATATKSYQLRLGAKLAAAEGPVLEPELTAFGEPDYSAIRAAVFIELYRRAAMRILGGGGWNFDKDGDGPYAGFRIKNWR